MAGRKRVDKKDSAREARRERMRQSAENVGAGFGGVSYLSLPEGLEMLKIKKLMSLDCIPYKVTSNDHPDGAPKGDLWYRFPFGVHKNIGVENKTYVCLNPKSPFESICPICKQLAPLWKNKDKNKEVLDANKRKERDLMLMIDLEGEEEGVVTLLDISHHLFTKQLLTEVKFGKEEYADFFELEGGFTLNTRWNPKSFGEANFFEISRIDFEAREDYSADIINPEYDPEKLLIKLEADKLEKIFLELESDTTDKTSDEVEEPEVEEPEVEEPEVEEPKKTRSSKKTRGSKRTRGSKKESDPEPEEKCQSGYEFGTADANENPECEKCDENLWNECMDKAGK